MRNVFLRLGPRIHDLGQKRFRDFALVSAIDVSTLLCARFARSCVHQDVWLWTICIGDTSCSYPTSGHRHRGKGGIDGTRLGSHARGPRVVGRPTGLSEDG